MNRTAPSQGPDANAERDAFDRALAPQFPELLQATRRELRHRLTLGHFAPDDPTSEQLLDMALQQAWRERARLSPALGVKAQALAAIFRMGEILAARRDERRQKTTELLPEEVEPDPRYEDDVEEFWQSHELDYPTTMRVFGGAADHPRDDAATDDELVGLLDPREREVLLMHEVHGVALPEIASAVRIPPTEAERLLASARDACAPQSRRRAERRAASQNKTHESCHCVLRLPMGSTKDAIVRRDVVGTAAGDQVPVDNDFLIHPVRSRVPEIGFQRRPRGHAASTRRAGFNDRPRTVADRSHWLAGVEKCFHESNRLRLRPECVGIDNATWQMQRVEILSVRFIEVHVD